jgi:glycosyltransferase involved in cell wall biosynthesis
MKPSNVNNANAICTSIDNAQGCRPNALRLHSLKVLVLTNWKNDGNWDLARTVEESVQRFDLLQPIPIGTSSKPGCFLNRLSYKWSEFYLPVLAMFRRNRYDVIVSWTSRLGVNYGFLNRLFRSTRAPKHIAVDFHIDLRRKDVGYRFRLALLRLALPGMDICFCTSTREERIYADMFSLPARRFRFLPMDYPRYFHYPEAPKKEYIFSYGKSGRDFTTLIGAAKGLETPVVVLSQTFQPEGEIPSNVTILRTEVSQDELIQLIRSARLVIIPLVHFDFSVGQIALTEVMSLGCPLLVTTNMATLEYAVNGKSALFYEAGDVVGLNSQIRFLVENPEIAKQLGDGARKQAREYAGRHAAVFLDTLGGFAIL